MIRGPLIILIGITIMVSPYILGKTNAYSFDFEAKIQELTRDSETRIWNIGDRRKKINKLEREILQLQGQILVNSGAIEAFEEVRAQEKVEKVKEEKVEEDKEK